MANIVQAHSRLKLEFEELVPSLVESLQKVQLLRHSADSLFSNLVKFPCKFIHANSIISRVKDVCSKMGKR